MAADSTPLPPPAAERSPDALRAAVAEVVARRFAGRKIPIFRKASLTLDEQVRIRDKPRPYLLATAEIVGLLGARTILEVGSMRSPLGHPIEAFDRLCCNDGHSTVMWCHHTSCDVFTVDVNPACRLAIAASCAPYAERVRVHTGDGIAYLEAFAGAVDLLFLDAWDVHPGKPYAERHLAAYQAIRPRLAPRHLVLIDDTDIAGGGKGRLLMPELDRRGYRRLLFGRQALYACGI
jgi:Methyltransferase domain